MRFVNEPIEVELHIGTDGSVRPGLFTWRGRRYPVTGVGRTYERGDSRYFLVMVPGDRIFELRWHVPDNQWSVSRIPQDRLAAA